MVQEGLGFFGSGEPWVMIFTASTISGSISDGKPITISSSVIPENFLDPSQPSEKFGGPVRYVCVVASEQTDWMPENSALISPAEPE